MRYLVTQRITIEVLSACVIRFAGETKTGFVRSPVRNTSLIFSSILAIRSETDPGASPGGSYLPVSNLFCSATACCEQYFRIVLKAT
jgi:hypothetical protein